jgi:hypothetical protein
MENKLTHVMIQEKIKRKSERTFFSRLLAQIAGIFS